MTDISIPAASEAVRARVLREREEAAAIAARRPDLIQPAERVRVHSTLHATNAAVSVHPDQVDGSRFVVEIGDLSPELLDMDRATAFHLYRSLGSALWPKGEEGVA